MSKTAKTKEKMSDITESVPVQQGSISLNKNELKIIVKGILAKKAETIRDLIKPYVGYKGEINNRSLSFEKFISSEAQEFLETQAQKVRKVLRNHRYNQIAAEFTENGVTLTGSYYYSIILNAAEEKKAKSYVAEARKLAENKRKEIEDAVAMLNRLASQEFLNMVIFNIQFEQLTGKSNGYDNLVAQITKIIDGALK